MAGLDTPLGVLLNITDMSVDSHGVEVGFDRRLADVAYRYGEIPTSTGNARE